MDAATLEVTRWRAFKVYWAMLWRGVMFNLGFGVALGLLFGLIGLMIGMERQTAFFMTLCILVVVTLWVWAWVVRKVLTKDFGEFRIVLLAGRAGQNG